MRRLKHTTSSRQEVCVLVAEGLDMRCFRGCTAIGIQTGPPNLQHPRETFPVGRTYWNMEGCSTQSPETKAAEGLAAPPRPIERRECTLTIE